MRWVLPAIATFFLTLYSQAKSLVIIGFEFEPFYFSDGSRGIQGACFEVLQRLCELESITCKFKIMPFRKALESLREGKVDATCPLVESTPRGSAYFFSSEVFESSYAFYGAPKLAKEIKKYEDIIGKTVVVFGPSNTELSLQKINEFLDHKIKIILEPTATKVLKKVDSNQYPLAYVNTDFAATWIKRNRSHLQEIPNLREYTAYRIAYSRKNVSKDLFDKMEEHLKTLKKSKAIKTIADKFKLKAADEP